MSGQIYELGSNGLVAVQEKFTDLKRGDIVRWGGNMGYPSEELVIIERFKGWEDRINYKVVNLKHSCESEDEYTPRIHQIEAYNIKDPKDPKLWHSQHHFITGKTATEEEIKKIVDFIPVAKLREERKKEAEIKAIKDAGLLTQSEKINLSTKEIASLIRGKLKKQFPKCKFSVTKKSYSYITVRLMKANFRIFRKFEELSEEVIIKYQDNGMRTIEQLKALVDSRHAQLNQYSCREEFNPDVWNNGHLLTEEAHKVLKEAVAIADYYNFDDSDSQTDYYSVNFSFDIQIGECDKPIVEVE